MKKTVFMDKYPVYTLSLKKSEVKYTNVLEIVNYFKAKIEGHPVAKFISVFDHYAHTKSLNGEIMEGLRDAQNIIFCFGQAIPNTKILAVRPRSIGICELEDSFIIEFIEAPKEEMHALMETWAKGLID
ncbi:MAG: hypothetical protein PHE60_02875 [Sulfurospirillaceae bacterium]|nr:hypothetical protein [Sulfurospirillaceae bacterium]